MAIPSQKVPIQWYHQGMKLSASNTPVQSPSQSLPRQKNPAFKVPLPSKSQWQLVSMLFQFVLGLLTFTGLTLCLVVLVSTYLSQYKTAFDLASHFLPQAAIGMLISALVFASLRKWIFTAIAFIGLAFAVYQIYPFYELQMPWVEKPPIAASSSQNIRLLQYNVLKTNTQYDAFIKYVHQVKPDIIVLQETGLDWANQLWTIEKEYPYNYVIPREDGFGISLYSKLPVEDIETRFFGDSRKYGYLPFPSLEATIHTKKGSLHLITTHPIPPVGGYTFRNSQLQQIGDYAKTIKAPLIVAGDMNVTPWSSHYKSLIANSDLTDTQKFSGLQPSWPVGEYVANQQNFVQQYNLEWAKGLVKQFARIPIDHILVNNQVIVTQRQLGEELGSDHLPVILDFQLSRR